jgi:hypothetical protein
VELYDKLASTSENQSGLQVFNEMTFIVEKFNGLKNGWTQNGCTMF